METKFKWQFILLTIYVTILYVLVLITNQRIKNLWENLNIMDDTDRNIVKRVEYQSQIDSMIVDAVRVADSTIVRMVLYPEDFYESKK